jgi:hypothetical protein
MYWLEELELKAKENFGTNSIVDMGSYDKAFLTAVYSMSDSDDITRLHRIN